MTESRAHLVPLSEIEIDLVTQDRAALDTATVTEYAEADLDEFPPVTIFALAEDRNVLVAGHHTVEACRVAGRKEVLAVIHKGGTLADAVRYAVGSNTRHGLRRSAADRRRAVQLLMEQCKPISNRDIARIAGIDEKRVREIIAELKEVSNCGKSAVGQSAKVNGHDGKARPETATATKAQQQAIRVALGSTPEASDRAVAKEVGCSPSTVAKVRKEEKPARDKPGKAAPGVSALTDGLGLPVPKHLREAFSQRMVFATLEADLAAAAAAINRLAHNPAGAVFKRSLKRLAGADEAEDKVRYKSHDLEALLKLVQHTAPYTSCPHCMERGKPCSRDGCRGAGFLTQDGWDMVPKALQKSHLATGGGA